MDLNQPTGWPEVVSHSNGTCRLANMGLEAPNITIESRFRTCILVKCGDSFRNQIRVWSSRSAVFSHCQKNTCRWCGLDEHRNIKACLGSTGWYPQLIDSDESSVERRTFEHHQYLGFQEFWHLLMYRIYNVHVHNSFCPLVYPSYLAYVYIYIYIYIYIYMNYRVYIYIYVLLCIYR